MKTIITYIGAILLFNNFGFGQNQSMTIAHTGISANDTLWVTPGEQIDFIYGSGGNHPMTSGQGATPSPVFFPTITVSSSIPLVTFSLTTEGTYIFHCGTNPGNTDNWGTIIVSATNSINENYANPTFELFPNPSAEVISIELGSQEIGEYTIFDLNGKSVMVGSVSTHENQIAVSTLDAGHYTITISINGKVSSTKFIKQ